ncbi:MAG TPA: alpha/beta fold hydrolase [Thermoanaerobaculia bacterium]|jgi:pimeloyl-ACP methyl ester carboxylesterase|nr:alpha/beta fold hydrolase [Thermoanaerobaculia bacterium]
MHFTIRSREGLAIRGDVDAPLSPRALIVLVHGFKGFKDWGFFPWLAERLCDEGYAVCRFNMSRSGIGENAETFERLDLFAEDTYSGQLADLRDVVSYAQSEFPELPTFLLGHSRGGGVALLGARDVPRLAGVITWSAIARTDRWDEAAKRKWREDGSREEVNSRTRQVMRMSTAILEDVEMHRERLDVLAAARGLEVPLLVIHGGRDESVPAGEGQQIAAQGRDVSLVVIGAASHTYNAIHPLIHVPFELSLAAEIAVRFIGAYA